MSNIVQQGDSDVLRKTADPVTDDEFGSGKLKKIITKMKSALHDTDDGVAIAAPQIGISKRIFLVRDSALKNRGDVPTEDKVFINPEITNTSQEMKELSEGCLSVRNIYGKVKRHRQATVQAQDFDGNQFELGGSGLLSQIFQHETEHLDGKLFVDKARDLREIDHKERRKNTDRED